MQLAPMLAPIRTPDHYTTEGMYRVMNRAIDALDGAVRDINSARPNGSTTTLPRTTRALELITSARTQAEEGLALLRNLHGRAGWQDIDDALITYSTKVTRGLDKLDTILRRYPDLTSEQLGQLANRASHEFVWAGDGLFEWISNR